MITSVYDINPSYLMKVSGTDENGDQVYIVGVGPDEFTLSAASNWEPIMPNFNVLNGISNGESSKLAAIKGAIETASRGTGVGTQSVIGSSLVWSGTSPLTFSMNTTFFAMSDAESEVLAPSMQLLSLSLPSQTMTDSSSSIASVVNNVTVRAPGPALINTQVNSYNIDLYIGQIYHFSNVIIEDAHVTNRSVYGANGLYLVSNVSFTVSTSKIYTKTDLQKVVGTRYSSGMSSMATGGGLLSSIL